MAFPLLPFLFAATGGAILFAMGGEKKASAAPGTSPTRGSDALANGSLDGKLVQAQQNGQLPAIVTAVANTGNPLKMWDLAAAMQRTNPGNPQAQAAADLLRIQAVELAVATNQLAPFASELLKRGEGPLLVATMRAAAQRNPALGAALNPFADAFDAQVTQAASAAASQILADAIKQTGTVLQGGTLPPLSVPQTPAAPSGAPSVPPFVPSFPQTTPAQQVVIPTQVITASPQQPAVSPQVKSAQAVRDHLRNVKRGSEDKTRVAQFQRNEGLKADGMYGAGTALAMAALGVVPVVPFYWPHAKADWMRKKADYKNQIASFAAQFPSRDWSSAIDGDAIHASVERS